MCRRFNSVDAADYTPPQRRAAASSSTAAVRGRAGTAAGATSGSGSLVAPLISIDMCRCGNGATDTDLVNVVMSLVV